MVKERKVIVQNTILGKFTDLLLTIIVTHNKSIEMPITNFHLPLSRIVSTTEMGTHIEHPRSKAVRVQLLVTKISKWRLKIGIPQQNNFSPFLQYGRNTSIVIYRLKIAELRN